MIVENLFDFGDTEEIETKTCSICSETKVVTEFGKASGGNYYRGECKKCAYDLMKSRELAKATAPPVPSNHSCPICNRLEHQVKGRGGKKSGAWCCDHDHSTGLFRGWLCHDCNRGIGNLGDDVNRLQNALNYINKTIKNENSIRH